jgi:hypothetical protein
VDGDDEPGDERAGYEQVRSIVAALAGDREAADSVQLDLPETGVCSSDLAGEAESGGCCGGTALSPEPVSIGFGAPAGVGFATGHPHGRSAGAGAEGGDV